MADAEDLRDLKAGERDMARRDFRNADLSNFDMSDRDFTAALFQSSTTKSANFSRSNLKDAETSRWNAEGSNFHSSVMTATSIFMVNFQNANLESANFSRSHFAQSNLSNTNLVGADFRNAHFDQDTTFDGAIADETTLFDGAKIFRATARQPEFRYYKVEKGELVRLPAGTEPSREPGSTFAAAQAAPPAFDPTVVALVDEIGQALTRLSPEQTHGTIGHNGPPESLPLETDDHRKLTEALGVLRAQAASAEPDSAVAQSAISSVQAAAAQVASWVAQKADLASEEFAKQLGKTLADGKVWLGAWLTFSGQLENLATLASRWLQ